MCLLTSMAINGIQVAFALPARLAVHLLSSKPQRIFLALNFFKLSKQDKP